MRTILLSALLCGGCFDYEHLSNGDAAGAMVDAAESADGGTLPDEGTAPDGASAVDLAKVCVQTLTGIGAGDFTIRFRLTTTASVLSSILYQRAECDAVKDFWNVNLSANGRLLVEVGQGNEGYATLNVAGIVNDGITHNIVVTRIATVLSVTVDDTFSGSTPASYLLGALPALGTASGNPCEAGGAGFPVPLVGTVSGVCVTVP